jgi:thiol-disulfide isomerase/thioredoxin
MRTLKAVAGNAAGSAPAVDAAARHCSAVCGAVAVLLLAGMLSLAAAAWADAPGEMPPFTHATAAEWLNAAPLGASDLRGHPVLIEVWTFECSNCLASLPWMKRIAAEYRPLGLIIVGVHTPELPEERDPAGVGRAVGRLGIGYPVMLDADFSYWRALGNHYWPAFYLYDAQGRLVSTRIGELHAGDPGAQAFERLIADQLAPPGIAPR